MHDCPACRTPLHGYEENCPVCGAKQSRRKGSGSSLFSNFRTEEPSINWTPIIIALVIFAGTLVFLVSNSWVGTLLTKGAPASDPMEKMSYQEARGLIENKMNEAMQANGVQGKMEWLAAGQPVDKNADQTVELKVSVQLPDKSMRNAIVDPIKEYMEKAKVATLTMTDEKLHATWTYNMVPAVQDNPASENAENAVP